MKKNTSVSGTNLLPIECLPTDFLSDKDLYNLSKTSSGMWFHCQAPLQERKNRAAEKILSHVVKGEEEQALKMIHAYPKFLLLASIATDYSQRTYSNYTPFQAALLCHDVNLWIKMEPYFDKLKDGQIEKATQFNALFPAGIPQGIPYDFSVLIQAITNSPDADIVAALQKTQNNTVICSALNHFRRNFNALAIQEMFFNPSHLMQVLDVYNEQFRDWSWNQRHLFSRQVIGYTQRFVPACLAQAFTQGLFNIVDKYQPLQRSLTFIEWSLAFKYDPGSYFPLKESAGLGFDFGGPVASGWLGQGGDGGLLIRLKDYEEKRQQSYSNLMQSLEEPLTDSDSLTSRGRSGPQK